MSVSFDSYKTFLLCCQAGKLYGGRKGALRDPATVTHAIQMLEQELDCVLFQRSRKVFP